MCSGGSRPGSTNTRGYEGSWAMNRGNDSTEEDESRETHEPPNESSHLGLWAPRHEPTNLVIESTRVKLALIALTLLGLFILAGIVSITWVTLAGKSAAELGIFMEVIATPLFGLAMLVAGYYYGHSTKHNRKRSID